MHTEHSIPPILPDPTLRRLPWYLAYLEILQSQGEKTVSSTRISQAINVDSSQIAKDLSFLDIKGKTRIGYDVDQLTETLTDFLGFRRTHRAVVVGAGSLGAALIHDKGLLNYGLEIVGAFDIAPERVGSDIMGVPVFHIDQMKLRLRELDAQIGILTVPSDQAQSVADTMVAAGLVGIWNFTPYRIRVRDGIVISNTSIYANLALIYNRMSSFIS